MQKTSNNAVSWRAVVLAAVTALGLVGYAQASIDFGSTVGPQGSRTAGVVDGTTGLTWAMSSSLDEGASLGFRAATTAEFRTLLTDTGWASHTGAGEQYTVGYAIPYDASRLGPSTTFGRMQPGYFGGAYARVFGLGNTFYFGAMGLLDGGQTGQVGLISDARSVVSDGCRTCTPHDSHQNRALIGNLEALANKDYDNADIRWSAVLEDSDPIYANTPDGVKLINYGQTRLASNIYFLVKEVPEPGTMALMGLGLLAVGLSQKRTRH